MSFVDQVHPTDRSPEVEPGADPDSRPLPRQRPHPVGLVAGIWAALLVATFITYTRLPPQELYHVSRDGIAGGLSRVLVEINFPIALVAIAVVIVALDRLPARWAWLGGLSILLCAVVAVPGVVDDKDLDAKWVNVVPAIGVAIAVALAIVAARRTEEASNALPLDTARIGLTALTVVLAIPLMAAAIGFFLPGTLFLTSEATGAAHAGEVAVHHGLHHGLDGALVFVSGLLLMRPRLVRTGWDHARRAYVALLTAYGAVNFFQDSWNEQIMKRGWADTSLRSAYRPQLTAIWGVVIALTALIWLGLAWEDRRLRARPADQAG
jgi:hypothetical protein